MFTQGAMRQHLNWLRHWWYWLASEARLRLIRVSKKERRANYWMLIACVLLVFRLKHCCAKVRTVKAVATVADPSFNQGWFLDDASSSTIKQRVPLEIFALNGKCTNNSADAIKKICPIDWMIEFRWWWTGGDNQWRHCHGKHPVFILDE